MQELHIIKIFRLKIVKNIFLNSEFSEIARKEVTKLNCNMTEANQYTQQNLSTWATLHQQQHEPHHSPMSNFDSGK